MSDSPKFKMVVRAVGNTKDEAWGNLNSVLCDACSSKYEQWEGQWPDYIDTNDGRIECVTIVASTNTSNTPFTDQNEEYAKDCGSHELVVLAHKVRQIESDLTAAKQQLDEVTKQRDALQEWKESAMKVESSWDAQAVGQLLEMKLGSAIHPQIEPAIRKMIAQRDGLVTACQALLMSPEVQGSWPLDGSKRAQKPSDTFSKAEAKVKFRHLLRIHSMIKKGGES